MSGGIVDKLVGAGIEKLSDLVDSTKEEILAINRVGASTLDKIVDALGKFGLTLKE